jgi:hypothetical protein
MTSELSAEHVTREGWKCEDVTPFESLKMSVKVRSRLTRRTTRAARISQASEATPNRKLWFVVAAYGFRRETVVHGT